MDAGPPSSSTSAGDGHWLDLPRVLLADIHGRLRFTDRLAFTAVFGDLSKPAAPWLVLPKHPRELYKTTFFSLVDRRAINVRACPLNDNVLLGSSGGWLAVADKEGGMHLINPVTGEQHGLPAITTMVGLNVISFINSSDYRSFRVFSFKKEDFLAIRFSGRSYEDESEHWRSFPGTVYTNGSDMGDRVHKVVLSASARPSSYAAMLILRWQGYRVPAFATAEDPAWRVATPRGDVVDAVHHRGRFYSLSRSGDVEVWDEKGLRSEVVTSGLPEGSFMRLATTPDGRLMVVYWHEVTNGHGYLPPSSKCSFMVRVLDEASGSWQETDDIGQAALLVGAAENSIMCVSTKEQYQNLMIRPNCVYFTDEVQQEVRVFSLRYRRLYKIEVFGQAGGLWKAAAWFTPSLP